MKLRYTQDLAIKKIVEAIGKGKTEIFLQAPTGTGKSLIALEISRHLLEKYKIKSYVLTSEKSLQQQYENDCQGKFSSYHKDVKSICGIDTYKCHVNGEKFSLGVCKSMGMGHKKALSLPCAATCEYLQRWVKAKEAERTIMNYSYYLIQMNYVLNKLGDIAPFNKRGVIICDEAHKLPDLIENHFAFQIKPKLGKHINYVLRELAKIGIMSAIRCEELDKDILECLKVPEKAEPAKHFDKLINLLDEFTSILSQLHEVKLKVIGRFDLFKMEVIPKEVKTFNSLLDQIKDYHCKLGDYVSIITNNINDLVACNQDEGRKYHNLSDSSLFQKHFQKFSGVRIFMSATLQPELLMKRWGIDKDKAIIMEIKSDWDPKKSPVILCNTTSMTYKNQKSSEEALEKIDEILEKHSNERGLIHTTTNALSEYIKENSKYADRIVSYNGTSEKLEILNSISTYKTNTVLIGPSLFTGVDFSDELARFNIICKLSYPNIASALWAKRYELKPEIYFGETASIIEQSSGRSTRHEDDHSITYILDSRAAHFFRNFKKNFSQSFLDRIQK